MTKEEREQVKDLLFLMMDEYQGEATKKAVMKWLKFKTSSMSGEKVPMYMGVLRQLLE